MTFSDTITLRWLRLTGMLVAVAVLIQGCADEIGNVTPRADLTFRILDQDDNPVPEARVYLFSSLKAYEAYLIANPNGDPSITPSLDPEDVSLSDADGEALFTNRALQTTSYPSGETYVHTPSPIFYRVIATQDGVFVTNDGGTESNRVLTFPDLESGEVVTDYIEVWVE